MMQITDRRDDHQSIAPCTSHRMSPSLTGPCVSRFTTLPPGLRLEVTSCKCQAHNSYSTKIMKTMCFMV
jgi:hypothetical protein